MPIGKFGFAQLMEFLPRHEFDACVRRYGGERRERGFSCRDQWLCLAFGQLTFRESLRDIETCLKLFPWARFRRRKGAVKLHTLIDLRGNIPTFVHVSHGIMADVRALDHLPLEPGAFYFMDRGYVDFARLYRFTQCGAYFVTRGKKKLDYTLRMRRPFDKTTGLRCDQTVVLAGPKSSQLYPAAMRVSGW